MKEKETIRKRFYAKKIIDELEEYMHERKRLKLYSKTEDRRFRLVVINNFFLECYLSQVFTF